MKILQSPLFRRTVKKFYKQQKLELDDQIRAIMKNPEIGEEKKGDLADIYVHKFKLQNTQYLLAYRLQEDKLELIMIGPHENYYRDLKKHLRNR